MSKKNIKVHRNKLILNQTFNENIKKYCIFKPSIEYQYYFLKCLLFYIFQKALLNILVLLKCISIKTLILLCQIKNNLRTIQPWNGKNLRTIQPQKIFAGSYKKKRVYLNLYSTSIFFKLEVKTCLKLL